MKIIIKGCLSYQKFVISQQISWEEKMKIKESITGKIAVLEISGNMMGGPELQELHQKIKSLISDDIRKVVIDLGGVQWMNSAGIGALMASLSSMKTSDGELKLSAVGEKIKSLLVVTQLLKLFDTYETKERAVASFQ